MKLLWPARVPKALAPGEVQVWAWTFGEEERDVEVLSSWLSEEEIERLQRFHFLKHRIQFAASHANLRRILGSYLNCHAKSISFAAGPYGKPALDTEHVENQISFNLTHSETVGLLAVGSEIEVGIDVETVRPIGPDVANGHFSAREMNELNTLHGDAWIEGFYRIWTRKEALLKAEGVGLNLPLADFDVSVMTGAPAALLAWRPTVDFSYSWVLHPLAPAEGVIGALAMSEAPTHIALSRYEA